MVDRLNTGRVIQTWIQFYARFIIIIYRGRRVDEFANSLEGKSGG